jgi:Ribbon-Helix-Helix transcriptional regulator family
MPGPGAQGRTALRKPLALHADTVRQPVARRALTFGLRRCSCASLEQVVAKRQRLQVQVPGLAPIGEDIAPELARAAIDSVTILGAFESSPEVRQTLSDRML